MSEEKKNMEDLLQSELDLGDTEAVGEIGRAHV